MTDILARTRMLTGSAAEWTANDLTLGDGEIVIERPASSTMPARFKIGNGTQKYSLLPFIGSELVSVKYFGAKGDGAADDTAAIQAAIDVSPGRSVYFPAGTYRITATLLVRADGTRLVGDGRNASSILLATADIDAVRFYCTSTATKTTFVNGVGLVGLSIYRTTASTLGAGIRTIQVNGGVFSDFAIYDMPEGFTQQGGQLTNIFNFQIFASGATFDMSATTNAALMSFKEAPITGGLFQSPFTTNVWGFQMSGSRKIYTCIAIAAADGLNFTDFYVANGFWSLADVVTLRNGSTVAAVSFGNGYFDGINNTNGTSYIVHVGEDGFTSSYVYSLTIEGCTLGNTKFGGILVRKKNMDRLSIDGNELINFNSWAIDVDAGATFTSVSASGNNLDGFSLQAGAGGMLIKNVKTFVACGGSITGGPLGGAAFNLGGTIGLVSITGQTIDNTASDLANSATIGSFVWSGNASSNNSPANSLRGLRLGNVNVTDANTLDWYTEQSAIPEISFGGANTGITYGTRNLTYTRVGNRILGECSIAVTNPGSFAPTATLLVVGLPKAVMATAPISPCSLRITGVTPGVGTNMLTASTIPGATAIRMDKMNPGGYLEQLSFADFTTTCTIQVGFNYPVDP